MLNSHGRNMKKILLKHLCTVLIHSFIHLLIYLFTSYLFDLQFIYLFTKWFLFRLIYIITFFIWSHIHKLDSAVASEHMIGWKHDLVAKHAPGTRWPLPILVPPCCRKGRHRKMVENWVQWDQEVRYWIALSSCSTEGWQSREASFFSRWKCASDFLWWNLKTDGTPQNLHWR